MHALCLLAMYRRSLQPGSSANLSVSFGSWRKLEEAAWLVLGTGISLLTQGDIRGGPSLQQLIDAYELMRAVPLSADWSIRGR